MLITSFDWFQKTKLFTGKNPPRKKRNYNTFNCWTGSFR